MLPSNNEIERVEGQLLTAQRMGNIPTVEIPLKHRFAPGVYLREVFMPAGSFVIGHEHKTEHFNIIVQGVASVMMGGKLFLLNAPHTVVSGPGVRKVLYIHEDCIWQTVHANPDNIRDLAKLDEMFVRHSPSYHIHISELEALKTALNYPTQ